MERVTPVMNNTKEENIETLACLYILFFRDEMMFRDSIIDDSCHQPVSLVCYSFHTTEIICGDVK